MSTLHPKEFALSTFAFVLVVCFTSSCSKTQTVMVEGGPAYQPKPSEATVKMPNVVAPKLGDVHAAVHRVFKDAAVVDTTVNPSFFVGDFNGDASQDLAVVLKPATGRVAELNEEYPPWLLRDPLLVEQAAKPKVSIQQQDVLLAIIHGYGDNDWRDAQATQTFLLKNAVGSNITIKTGKDFAQEHSGKKLPRPRGDLIAENLRGVNGYLFYASSSYQWYDPKTFKPRTDIGMVHARSSRTSN
jgi:hypothetical protein